MSELFAPDLRPASEESRSDVTTLEVSAQAIRTAIWAVEGGGCPVRSSITDLPCLLREGHPMWDATRFHRYAGPWLRRDRP